MNRIPFAHQPIYPFPGEKIPEPQEHPVLKELEAQNMPDEELQEWREFIRKHSEAKRRKPKSTHPELTVIVFGLAGMGKSTLLNSLLQNEVFPTGSTEHSSGVTKHIVSAEKTCGNFVLQTIDTPGFGDLTVSPKEWCIQFYFNAYQTKADLLLFVLRADSHKIGRWNLILAKFMAEFIKDDREGNPGQNIALVFTHTDKLNERENNELKQKCERIKEQLNQMIAKSWKIEQIFYFAKDQADDVRDIFEYALEIKKEKKLELKFPNLTLIKNVLKEEFNYDEEEERKKKWKKAEHEKRIEKMSQKPPFSPGESRRAGCLPWWP